MIKKSQDTALITKRATKNIKGGDLVLMHLTEKTAEALPGIISAVSNAG